MPNIVYIAASIDGYIAKKDGNIDWLMEVPNPNNSDYGFFEFMKRVDGVLMGKHTFETAAGFDQWIYNKPVFVLSNTLKEVPPPFAAKAEIVSGDLKEVLKGLSSRGFNTLYIDGGKTIQSFMADDLIDELIITRIPIVLGSGIPLFDNNGLEQKFEHVSTQVYDNILVKSHYVRKR